ncbi:protein NRT1/ PTR FAMILY 4.5-like [Triticum dicoccoides]|nr:protein NRT1/ PTR FAMILY 4.5-like [Triticum dicoccoides]
MPLIGAAKRVLQSEGKGASVEFRRVPKMEYKEDGKAAETNGKSETHQVVGGKQYEVIEGKVNWRGMPAVRGRHGGVGNSFFILVNFGLENLASLSLAVNLIMYFMLVMHINLADASNLLTDYMGTSYMIAVLITVFADTFVGRYQTVIISSLVELIGLLLMTLQAHSPKLLPKGCKWPEPTCQRVGGHSETRLYVGLYLVAIGSAGIKAALPAHCADQFDAKHPRERRQMSSFFNWLLLSLCIGGAVSVTVFVWIQNVKGWDKGFGAATGVMGLALIAFLVGMPRYRIFTAQGSSALLEIFRVYVAAIRNRNLQLPENPAELYEMSRSKASPEEEFVSHRDRPFRFLDRAAIVQAPTAEAPNPWRQCRVTHVEHAKTVLAMVPIFCSAIIMGTCLAQFQTFSIQQGSTMNTWVGGFQMQPATLPIIPLAMLIFAVPIYERLFVPFARGITGHPNGIPYLQRVGVGLVLSIFSMCIAAVVEMHRKKVAVRHGKLDAIPMLDPLPMSVFWLAPQYGVFGIADMFTYIGLLEFFYSQAPPALKSMSSAFLWASMSLGYYFSTIIVKAVNAATKKHTLSGGWLNGNNINRNHLDLFFWLLAVLSFINFLNYLYWASWYKYVKPQDEEDNVVAPVEQQV